MREAIENRWISACGGRTSRCVFGMEQLPSVALLLTFFCCAHCHGSLDVPTAPQADPFHLALQYSKIKFKTTSRQNTAFPAMQRELLMAVFGVSFLVLFVTSLGSCTFFLADILGACPLSCSWCSSWFVLGEEPLCQFSTP